MALRFSLTAVRIQRVFRQGRALIVSASCNETCAVSVHGWINRRFHHRLVRIAPVSATLRGGAATELKMPLSRRALVLVRRGLRHHQRMIATVVGQALAGRHVVQQRVHIRLLR